MTVRSSSAVGVSTRFRLFLVGALYFAQGVPYGFVTVALLLRLTGLGLGASAIGRVMAVAAIPWAGKLVLGPLVDRFAHLRPGARRLIILTAEFGMAVTLVMMAALDAARSLPWLMALVFAHNVFVAAQDVATDALAMLLLPVAQRGRANGVMWASKVLGVAVGGPGLSVVLGRADWPVAVGIAVALVLAPVPLVWLAQEPSAAPTPRPQILRRALRALTGRLSLVAGLVALIAGASDHLSAPLLMPLVKTQLGYSDARVNTMVSVATFSVAAGALLGGPLIDRLGHARALMLGLLAQAGSMIAFAAIAPWWGHPGWMLAYAVASGVLGGAFQCALLAFFMDVSSPRIAATQFQFYMALANLRGVWGGLVGGWLAGVVSPRVFYLMVAPVELVALGLLSFMAWTTAPDTPA